MFHNVKKILIFKLCCFGDSVFITPAVSSLRHDFPDSEIIFAHADWIKPMISFIPDIDGGILFENVYDRNIFGKLKGTLKFIKMIRKQKFDMVLYGHRSNLLSFVLMLCGVRYRLGFEGTKHLTHKSVFNSGMPEYERYQRILSDNGLSALRSLPKLKKPNVSAYREKMKLVSGQKVLGIFPEGGNNPGTKMDIKKLDFDKYIGLARMIVSEFPDLKIIFFEGTYSDEKFKLPEVLKAVKETIKNELIACCDYFISGDTGSLHIAAAMGVPTVSIFGPSDPRILSPVNPNDSAKKHLYVWKKPECSPCYTPETAIDKTNRKYWKNNNFVCHTGTHKCMKSVTSVEIYTEFKKLIEVTEQVN